MTDSPIKIGLDSPARVQFEEEKRKAMDTLLHMFRRISVPDDACTLESGRTKVSYYLLNPGGDQLPNLEALMQCLTDLAVFYVINDRRVELAMAEGYVKYGKLVREALKKFSPSTTSGEFGEFILYGLLEREQGAKQALAKMEHKDDQNTFVKGADAIHVKVEGKTIHLFWGESKVEDSIYNGLTRAFESLGNFLDSADRRDDESNLLIPTDSQLTPEVLQVLEAHFRGGNLQGFAIREHLAVFVCFSWDKFASLIQQHGAGADSFVQEQLKKYAPSMLKLIEDRMPIKNRTGAQDMTMYFLPVHDVQAARDRFRHVLSMGQV